MREIVRNAARCKICGDVIESKFRHDMKRCSCGTIGVDGGHDYLKRVFRGESYEEVAEDLSEWIGEDEEDDDDDECY